MTADTAKHYYTVAEVAEEFRVTGAAVRDWIGKRKLLAIQPSGARGEYLIPATALEVARHRMAGGSVRREQPTPLGRSVELWAERIKPVVDETGLSPDELLRRMATDQALVVRYPSFASDYTAYVTTIASRAGVASSGVADAVG